MHITHTVQKSEDNKKVLDIVKTRYLFSNLQIKRIKQHGSLTINQKPARFLDIVHEKDEISLSLDDESSSKKIKEHKNIDILYQDDWYLVCNKPSGLVTHPTFLHQKDSLTQNLSTSALHPVSRLDKDTSGLILIAKNGYAQQATLQKPITKKYLALVHGVPQEKTGLIDLPILRANDSIILRQVHSLGKPAQTKYRVVESYKKAQASLLEFELLTGRTHQIRLHCLESGFSIIGETLYGCDRYFKDWKKTKTQIELEEKKQLEREKAKTYQTGRGSTYQGPFLINHEHMGDSESKNYLNLNQDLCYKWNSLMPRQSLHAYELSFYHPIETNRYTFSTNLPQDLQALLKNIRAFDQGLS